VRRSFRAGLVLLGLLSVLDVAGLALTDGEHPPYWVAVVGAVLGAASLLLLLPAWRGNRPAVLALVVLRAVSAVTALPAFVEPDVPVEIMALAGGIVLVTVVGCALALPAVRSVDRAV
jgi:hypothetical protein